MNKIILILIAVLLLVSTGIGEAITGPIIKTDKDFIFEDNNRINLPILTINSPFDGYEYFTSNILVNISAWSNNGECFEYECEIYEEDECLGDPEGFGNCFFDDEGDCDTFECWDIGDYNQCISESCDWNTNCMSPVDCWEYEGNQTACDAEPSCFWDDEWDFCTNVVDCWGYEGNQTACDAEPYCEWEGSCQIPQIQCGEIEDYDECSLIENDYNSCDWNGDNETGYCENGLGCWDFHNESDCSTDNEYDLTCYWNEISEECNEPECEYLEENETSCEDNSYEIDCHWEPEELENVWYNINYGENFSYLGEIFYSFEDGENILTACANNSDGLTGCETSEFNSSDSVSCGYTITEDTILTEDILDCPGDGLIIGANDITLDCDNHLIEGDYYGSNESAGISIIQINGTTIINCNVFGFENGIKLYHSNSNNISHNSFNYNDFNGINLTSSSYNLIHKNNIGDYEGSNTNTDGIYLGYHSDYNNISHNSIRNNSNGIFLYEDNDDNNIYGNLVSNNNNNGIWFFNNEDNNIYYNVVSYNGRGIYFTDHSNYNNFYNNTVKYNDNWGIYLYWYSHYNSIWNNTFLNNGYVNETCLENESDCSTDNQYYNAHVDHNNYKNYWNLSDIGNYWSDFEENSGYPYFYNISTEGNNNDAIDWHPVGAEEMPLLGCGYTITEDTILTEDILDCPGDGLIIGANDITLNCTNHLITGDNDYSSKGVYLFQVNGTTIINCNVSGFANGIKLYHSNLNNISYNIFSDNDFNGINLTHSSYNDIYDNDIGDNGNNSNILNDNGISLGYQSDYNNIASNYIENNSGGIYLSDSNGNNNIFGNRISNNGRGIHFHVYNNDNTIFSNIISYNKNNSGISLSYHNDNNIIYDNFVSYNNNSGIFLLISNNDNTIWNNSFMYNGNYTNQSNAYQHSESHSNWNLSEIGNSWSDFEDNPGYPYFYNISGDSDGIDWHPVGAEEMPLLGCGYTITEDTILTEDILDCPGDGLIIGANDITLDCDNHIIRGTNNQGIGISLYGVNETNIINCNVENFLNGTTIFADGPNHLVTFNNLFNNTFSYNEIGISLTSTNGDAPRYNNIYNNTITQNFIGGLILDYGSYNGIWNNTFLNNGNYNAHVEHLNTDSENGNYWNLSDIGNYWSDFEDNFGYPCYYNISDYNIDWHPLNPSNELCDTTNPTVNIVSPEYNEVFDTPEVLINLSAWDNFGVDTVIYSLARIVIHSGDDFWIDEYIIFNETYTGPVNINLPNYNYYLYASVNDTSGNRGDGNVSFTVNVAEPIVTIHSPVDGIMFNDISQILINLSADSDFGIDTLIYNYSDGWIEYTEPIYVDIDNLVYGYNYFPGWGSDVGYHMKVCANDTVGNERCGFTRFNVTNTPPWITIETPYANGMYYVYDQSSIEVLLNISTGDNLGIDTIWYDINNESAVIYEEQIFLEFEIGNYTLTACVNDSLGQIDCDVTNFMVGDNNGPEILIHSPLGGLTYETAQILVNLSASDNVEVDTIWYNYTGYDYNGYITYSEEIIYYENPVYEDFNLGYNHFYTCVNDSSGNTNCESIQFHVSMPDLIVTNITSSLSEAGDETTIDVTFKNIGLEPSDYYYAYTFDYNGRDLIRESFSGRGLEPGEESTVSVSYVYDFAGNYTFYFELDQDNLIDEFNESNNIGLESYFIDGTPDLTSGLLSFEQSYENPNQVTFNIEISALEGTIWVDDFSYNIEYGDGEGEGGSISETIMPWESYNFSLTHEYSTFGDYNVFFEVDPENLIFELNESNNFFETSINLEEGTCLKGDVNGDGTINVLDIVHLVSIMLGETEPTASELCAADYNSDGEANVLDIVTLVDIVLGG